MWPRKIFLASLFRVFRNNSQWKPLPERSLSNTKQSLLSNLQWSPVASQASNIPFLFFSLHFPQSGNSAVVADITVKGESSIFSAFLRYLNISAACSTDSALGSKGNVSHVTRNLDVCSFFFRWLDCHSPGVACTCLFPLQGSQALMRWGSCPLSVAHRKCGKKTFTVVLPPLCDLTHGESTAGASPYRRFFLWTDTDWYPPCGKKNPPKN